MSTALTSPGAQAEGEYRWGVNVANFVSSKLHSSNYRPWKEQMLCLIESQGLLSFVDGTAIPPAEDDQDYAAWRRTDRLVKGWILGSLTDSVIESVFNFGTAMDVWVQLEKRFSKPAPPAFGADQEREWQKYLALYKAALNCEWDKMREIHEEDPNALNARVAFTLETALHVAVSGGKSTRFVEKLVGIMSDELVAARDQRGCNALHVAALTGNLPAAQILVRRLPDLLYVVNNGGHYPVHLAAKSGHRRTLQFLVLHTRDDHPTYPFAHQTALTLLLMLIDADFLDMAVAFVEKYPQLARMKLADDSALMRIAVKKTVFSIKAQLNLFQRVIYSCIQVEVEPQLPIMQTSDIENQTCGALLLHELQRWYKVVGKLWPSLSRLIIHLVPGIRKVYEKKVMHEQALRLVKWLCKHLESLTHKEARDIYIWPMLTAAELGNVEVIEAIVEAYPPAIYVAHPITRQTFLHIAVQNRSETVFNLIYRTGNQIYQYVNDTDSSGNSILHLAAALAPPHKLNLVSGAALQMQRELQWFKEADKFVNPYNRGRANKYAKTPEMIFTEQHRQLKIEGEKWMKDTANSCTIAAALIVTVLFAAAITVPGGNGSSGYPVFLGTRAAFTVFAVSDAISLFTSTTSLLMFLSILTSRYAEEDFLYALPKRLCIGLFTLFLSILFMMVAFGSTLYLVFGRNEAWILIPVIAFACFPISSFVLLQFPLLLALVSSTYGRGIFGKHSDRRFH